MATILVAAPEQAFREVLDRVLTGYGHDVATAETFEEVLTHVAARSPSVAILDPALSNLSAHELLTRLHTAAPHVVTIVVAGAASNELKRRVGDIGIVAVLRKGRLMETIMQAADFALQYGRLVDEKSLPMGRPDRPRHPIAHWPMPERILVVDDEREICSLIGEFLARRGYQIRTAFRGKDALAAIHAESPDLVLLDLYMPDMNGVEVLRQLRQTPFTHNHGIVVLTASREELLLEEALTLGAYDVLTKPIKLDQLELAVAVKLALNAGEEPFKASRKRM